MTNKNTKVKHTIHINVPAAPPFTATATVKYEFEVVKVARYQVKYSKDSRSPSIFSFSPDVICECDSEVQAQKIATMMANQY